MRADVRWRSLPSQKNITLHLDEKPCLAVVVFNLHYMAYEDQLRNILGRGKEAFIYLLNRHNYYNYYDKNNNNDILFIHVV